MRRILIPLLVGFWPLAAGQPARALVLSFISASDTHYCDPDDMNDRERAIEATINSVSSRTLAGAAIHPLRGVLDIGDLLNNGTSTEWSNWSRDWGLTGGDGSVLQYPVYETFGGTGHDGTISQSNIITRNSNHFGLTAADSATGDCSWDWGGVHFVTAGVNVSGSDLTWLQNDLAANVGTSGRPVVLMEHEDKSLLAQSLYDNLLKNYNVVAILDGHAAAGTGTWNGITVLDSNNFLNGYYVVQISGTSLKASSRTTGGSGNLGTSATATITVPSCLATLTATGGCSWGTASAWSGGATPQSQGDYAFFDASIGATPATITLDGTRTVSGLDFDNPAAGYTIAPGTPAGRLVFQKSNGAVSLTANGSHLITAPVTLNNDAAIMVQPNSQLTMTGAIDGAGKGLAKAGNGTLVLAASNTYSGPTTIADGTLRLANASGVPGGIGVTGGTSNIVFDGGILELTDTDFLRPLGTAASQVQFIGPGGFSSYGSSGDRSVNLGGTAAAVTWGSGSFVPVGSALLLGSAAGTLHFQNPIAVGTGTRTIDVSQGAAQLDGGVSGGGGLMKTGAGTLILPRSCTYTGSTLISAGTLQLGASGAGGGDFTLSGVIAGSGTLTKVGSNVLTLGGTNLCTGGMSVLGGTLKLANSAALGFGVPAACGGALPNPTVSGTLDLAGKSLGGLFTLAGGGLVNSSTAQTTIYSLAGVTPTSGGTAISGTNAAVTLSGGGGAGAAAVASLGLTAASITFTSGGIEYVAGDILHVTGGGGSGALIKVNSTGAITSWTLIDPGSGYTSAPTGVVGGGGGGGVNGRNATISGNADNFQVVSLSTTAAGSGYTAPPAVSMASGSGFAATAVLSAINLASDSSIGGAGNMTVAAQVGGAGGLTKIGNGKVSLAAANTYQGRTTVSAGTLEIAAADAVPPGNNVTIAGGGHVVLSSGLSHAISLGGLTITSAVGQASPLVPQIVGVGAGQTVPDAPAPTPEPGTLILLAAGAAMGMAARRRNVSFRRVCVKRFGQCGIVGCQRTNLWRTADGYQKGTRPACPTGEGPAAIRALAADP